MTSRSLRFRLLAAAAVSIVVALVVAGLSLVALFERHVERRVDAELETYLRQLIGRISLQQDGRVHVTSDLADPRFDEPLSGLYWQVQDDERPTLLRSRSLWDQVIELPRDALRLGEVHRHRLPGPAGQSLLVRERQVILHPESRARRLRVAVALDRGELTAARQTFAGDMLPYFALLAAALMAATGLQVRTGLAPLEHVRSGVLDIHGGRRQRLGDGYPDEVTPLVEEINQLLEARDRSVDKARAWTADLAHGLKTPLSALGAEAERLRAKGHHDMADSLDQLAQSMRRRVDRELIRARLRSAAPGAVERADLAAAVTRVVATLERTPDGARLAWLRQMPQSLAVAVNGDDLMELLGNLLDNAGKWATATVRVTLSANGDARVVIEDDGPGVPGDQLGRLGERGLRLDEQIPGHGLGLAIARDIVEAYGGSIDFTRASLGGLAVAVVLPRG